MILCWALKILLSLAPPQTGQCCWNREDLCDLKDSAASLSLANTVNKFNMFFSRVSLVTFSVHPWAILNSLALKTIMTHSYSYCTVKDTGISKQWQPVLSTEMTALLVCVVYIVLSAWQQKQSSGKHRFDINFTLHLLAYSSASHEAVISWHYLHMMNHSS